MPIHKSLVTNNQNETAESLQLSKQHLRTLLRAMQKSLSPCYIQEASNSIQSQVLSSPLYMDALSIFTYISLPFEPSTEQIIRQSFADGKLVYVPKCVDGKMLAVHIHDLDGLTPGAYGIPEPTELADTVVANEIDLILVPCISAFMDGRRLGHGAGYYDRFIESNRDNTICLCFRKMLRSDIPMTDNDVWMAHVITD